MLSKKMAVSLMSLITIFALALVTVPVMAANDFGVWVNFDSNVRGEDIKVTVSFNEIVGLVNAKKAEIIVRIVKSDGTEAALATDKYSIAQVDTNSIQPGDQFRGNYFGFTIGSAYTKTDNDGVKVSSIQVFVPAGVNTANLANERSSIKGSRTVYLVDSIDADDLADIPKVVSIQRLRPGSQTVASAFEDERIAAEPFDVRIVLTEYPHGIDDLTGVDVDKAAQNLVEVVGGTASDLVIGVPFVQQGTEKKTFIPHPSEGMYDHELPSVQEGADEKLVPAATGDDKLYYQFRVTITPHKRSYEWNQVTIHVKEFHNNENPSRKIYLLPNWWGPNGRDRLSVWVKGARRDLKAGYKVTIPKDWIIPANGYLIVARDLIESRIEAGPGPLGAWRTNDTPRATHRTPAQLKYNVIGVSALPNLATQFLNGVVVDVESQHDGLVISEVMWGEDVSLVDRTYSQYIELYNPGVQYKTIDDKDETPDINEALTLIFYAPNEFDAVPAKTAAVAATATAAAVPAAPIGVTDRIGTLDAKGAYWPPLQGQSGSSGIPLEDDADLEVTIARTAITPIVSMYRAMVPDTSTGAAVDAMMPADGQMAANWKSSQGPKSANFKPLAIGVRYGTPGAATDATVTPADIADDAKAIKDKADADKKTLDSTGTYPTLGQGRVYISEVMFAGGGTLPQWIEIANGDRVETFNLSGWTLTVDNAVDDTDVSVGATATFTIPNGTKIAPSERHDPTGDNTPSTILVVTEAGRDNITGPNASGQIINLDKDNEVELILAGVTKGKYTLLSAEAFLITLAPPEPEATKPPAGETVAAKATRRADEKKAAAERKLATDRVGNLSTDGTVAWALPMSEEGGRSSIIRRHAKVVRGPAEPYGDKDGNAIMAEDWVLASETAFTDVTHIRVRSYYGAANDEGTPGFRAGGALPVELSHFRPARDKVTGTVAITWSTQSELNNAGFFIKRSQQKDGEFKIINATMIAGAGTTSEKQSYTYTDTTAQPNVVYYYQIEDVSLDGNHQTLTRGIRLKGHVSVAGKATLTWGELKTSQ